MPKFNGVEKKVCLPCYDKISKGKQATGSEPMDMYVRVSMVYSFNIIDLCFSDAPLPPGTSPMDAPIPPEAQGDLDEEIRNRLINLKDDRLNSKTPAESDSDIAIRISNLKGVPHKEHSNADILLNLDTRTDEEKTRDLVKQFMEESQLDEQADPIKDIERRLAALKGSSSSQDIKIDVNKDGDKDSDSDEEVKVKKMVVKV